MAVTLFSPFLFSAPKTHFTGLQEVFADDILALGPWIEFMNRLREEWKEYILYVRPFLAVIQFYSCFDFLVDCAVECQRRFLGDQ
jgi:hypothetical protein